MRNIKLLGIGLALMASLPMVKAQEKSDQSFVHQQSEAADYVWRNRHK